MSLGKLSENEAALTLVAHGQFTDVALADAAASDKAQGILIRFAVKDPVHPEIVLGEMIVSVFAGSEVIIQKVMEGLQQIPDVEMKRSDR